ncbi:hypothetical protein EC973_009145 [Apophysomyces ossiformis]|uniref:RNA-binding protein n=1 Tax=Apophysomyces ossiformis TaxID=679940 RepID=A0A8H7ET58_9FUNG|nr:hypothetical protein EC973_009145 [Apophysomyces ossiformis]
MIFDSPRRPPPPQEQIQPNINVVLRSLPEFAQERDIQKTLESMDASVDEVTLIRDRETGESRKFAFVRFTSVGHAIQFVDKHYPYFFMGHQRVRLDYCHKDGAKDDRVEWRCTRCNKFNDDSRRVCIECRTPCEVSTVEKRSNTTESMDINDGSKDASFAPSGMILLRNLDNLSTEESIYNAVKHFEGVRRVLLIKDKLAKMSCEFAFVEFENLQLAAKALGSMGNGLKIDNRKVTTSYANPDSFLPVYVASEWAVQADVPDGLWAYWDKQAYACEYSPAVEMERARKLEEAERAKEERRKKEEKEKEKQKQLQEKNTDECLEDDLSAFYAEMGDVFSEEKGNDIFSVPK